MKTMLSPRRHHYLATVSTFLITVALIAGMVGCPADDDHPADATELETWYELDAIGDSPGGSYVLMNDLDSGTDGYKELAGPDANDGKGWKPIGTSASPFVGTLDGQEHTIEGLFINRPDEEGPVGLFGYVDEDGFIKNVGVVNLNVSGEDRVGGLVGLNTGHVLQSDGEGIVTGDAFVGGVAGFNLGFGSRLNHSSFDGDVTNPPDAGSLTALNEGTASNPHSSDTAPDGWYVGGLGEWNDGGTVADCFWDTDASGIQEGDWGAGMTTEKMKDINTYLEAGGDI